MADQRVTIFERVQQQGGIYLLDDPGGNGQTFLISLLFNKIYQHKGITFAVSSSDIHVYCFHSNFKLSLDFGTNDAA